jgi:hypothetical protein
MVDARSTIPVLPRRRRGTDSAALTARLQVLTRHPNDELSNAALAVLRQIQATPELFDARRFHAVYFEILRQAKSLSDEHRRREWRAIRGLSVGVYHLLIRRFRDEVKEQHRARCHSQETRVRRPIAVGTRP